MSGIAAVGMTGVTSKDKSRHGPVEETSGQGEGLVHHARFNAWGILRGELHP
jgi:hypothetical protein